MWIGDFNNDGAINMSDIVELVNYFNTAPGDGKYNADFDLNKDNAINMTDILIIIEHFNTTTVNYPTNDFEIKVITDPIGGTSTPKPTNTPTPTPDNGIKEWSSDNVSYKLGDKVSYQGSIYECTYAHSSNTAWTPVAAGTLWKKI
ncbi:MAG: dockerin type I domain-containing protein [Clostridia bacterium]|nr:dockerin type I domain-containing protein [Clostridia bacterium]